jgi:hypothetical protein
MLNTKEKSLLMNMKKRNRVTLFKLSQKTLIEGQGVTEERLMTNY